MIDEKKELKTIKELATELGVSKQTIQYHIKFYKGKLSKQISIKTILVTL